MSSEVKVGFCLLARLPDKTVEDQTGYSPTNLGESIADQAIQCARDAQLGYFPPLDYLVENGALDKDVHALATQVSDRITEYASKDICFHLEEAFETVEVKNVKNMAFTMPKVRRHQPDALEALTLHYSPAHVKFDIVVTTLDQDDIGCPPDILVKNRVMRFLKERFVAMEITETHFL